MLLSRSKRAPAIAFSSSEGFCRDGELRAILLMAAMIASDGAEVLVAGVGGGRCALIKRWEFAVGSAASLRARLRLIRLSVISC